MTVRTTTAVVVAAAAVVAAVVVVAVVVAANNSKNSNNLKVIALKSCAAVIAEAEAAVCFVLALAATFAVTCLAVFEFVEPAGGSEMQW